MLKLNVRLNSLPLVLFIAAIVLTIFGYGVVVGRYYVFPFRIISDGIKTGKVLLDVMIEDDRIVNMKDTGFYLRFSDMPLENPVSDRVEFVAGNELAAPVLWTGGRYQFREYCPDSGCLAVEYNRRGEVTHAYPLRLDELEKAQETADDGEFPYEFSPIFSFVRDIQVSGVSRYSNGDLLVVFHYSEVAFPYGAGVARIDRDGHVVWFRSDYSHHWAQILDDDTALVPSMRIGSDPVSFQLRGKTIRIRDCNRPYRDSVHIIDEDGRLLKHINLLDVLLASPSAPALQHALNSCAPLHLNFIHVLGDDAGGAWGIGPGDLVVSLRNISAFAILDRETGRVKRLVRGNFLLQHSVQHLEESTFLMFDNQGYDEVGGPSRLLAVDLVDGRETTIFPNRSTPESLRDLFFSNEVGYIAISADRRRVLVAFSRASVGVEVRLADGEIMSIFRSLHDVSSLDQFPNERKTKAALFQIRGLEYIHE